MKYSKPQIVASADAVVAIQGSPKDLSAQDSNGSDLQSIAAYEADE